jgi:hypothetical protein
MTVTTHLIRILQEENERKDTKKKKKEQTHVCVIFAQLAQ